MNTLQKDEEILKLLKAEQVEAAGDIEIGTMETYSRGSGNGGDIYLSSSYGLRFLESVSLIQFKDALTVQEEHSPRCYLKKLVDWANSQGYLVFTNSKLEPQIRYLCKKNYAALGISYKRLSDKERAAPRSCHF